MARDYSEIVKFKGYFVRCIYPKKGAKLLGVDDDHRYGITKWDIEEEISGDITYPDGGKLITLVGDFFVNPDPKVLYTIAAKKTSTPRYGLQYEVIYINQVVDFDDIENFKEFLTQITTQLQRDALYEKFENPLEVIAHKDIEALMSVKGIGPAYASMIIQKYEEKKDDSELFVKLNSFGMTPLMMNKLKCTYGSNKRVIEIMEKNPYQMVFDVEGVGFKTADAIALNSGINPKSLQRISAFIYFLLNEELNSGNSFLTAIELNRAITNFFGGKDYIYEEVYDEDGKVIGNNISEAIESLEEQRIIGIEDNENKSLRRVFLLTSYRLEERIAWNLDRLMKATTDNFTCNDFDERLAKVEEQQGFKFSPEQVDGIKLGLESNVCFISGAAGCVDADTEFFDGNQWKKISAYQQGDKVLQWVKPENKDWAHGCAELVNPIKYIKLPCEKLYHFETKYGVSQTLSNDHRIIAISPKNAFNEYRIDDLRDANTGLLQDHWNQRFITTFNYNGDGNGIQLTDDEIRLTVAFIADGSIQCVKTRHGRFHIKKERKQGRLKELFKKCGIEYKEHVSVTPGYIDFSFYMQELMCTKVFGPGWYKCNNHQMQVICDELIYWDGSCNITNNGIERKCISTTVKENADFIQFAYASTGSRAIINVNDRRGRIRVINGKEYTTKSIDYNVMPTKRTLIGLCGDTCASHTKTEISEIESVDGFKYCFSVPSSYLVLRKDNCIFITGNCGKSSLVSGLIEMLQGHSIAQTSLSGKAAARLTEVTHIESSTIHKLLGWNPAASQFTYNLTNQLPYDIIVLDEVSMVGGDIFLSLLNAIPNGSKLIMLGDISQLPSIGALNLAQDMFNSPKIPRVNLTTIHRQKAGGIITVSHEIRNMRQIFGPEDTGILPFGEEKQDMIFDLFQDSDEIRGRALKWFEKGFNSPLVNKNISEIQIISPVKERGDSCVFNLNLDVQEYLLSKGLVKNDEGFPMGFGNGAYKIHTNDKILCIKNNYHAKGVSGAKISIFNGWNGQIKEIFYPDEMIKIHFDLAEEDVFMSFTEARNHIILGYACTCHKLQGSQAKVVIGVIDYSTPPSMLTCQLLYTLITRATKRCIVVGQNSAIRQSISTNYVSSKRTFLPELLEGNEVEWRQKK